MVIWWVQNIEWNFNNQNNLYSNEHLILTQQFFVKFVSDLRQVSGFLWVLRFPPPIKLTARYNWNIVVSGVKHHKLNQIAILNYWKICLKLHQTFWSISCLFYTGYSKDFSVISKASFQCTMKVLLIFC